MLRGACLIGLVLFIVVGAGCAPVKPWERGRLARPRMLLEPSPDGALLEQHVFEYREGSAGGFGAVGGGCGCN